MLLIAVKKYFSMIMSLARLFPERGTDTPSRLENTSVTHYHNVDAAVTTVSMTVIMKQAPYCS